MESGRVPALARAALDAPFEFEFAYVDETGDKGDPAVSPGATRTCTLGCVLVPGGDWTDRLDWLTGVRREIRDTYGILLRHELKANVLLRGRGDLRHLGLGGGQRRDVFRRSLGALSVVASGVFAIVIDKEARPMDYRPEDRAWTYLLQRLRIRSEQSGKPIILVHDAGDDATVRAIHRRFRRHSFAPGGSRVSAPLLVEDPVPRDSASSYFVQAADLVAYAGFRRFQAPGAKSGSVCDETMWDELRPVWRTEVTNARRDAIVVWP
ncbi:MULTISPECIES: DUF3800 domain-containing protein [unclassified Curtobacterium]|uniref:DUF3800 domain-containing protein n=1 Tax=unclassified Curtobacterium TaxID=257496 RepID=UPI001050DEFB|nr:MULTISPECIES: DUF3800 domain-containing protein [unclassified Curtobacterium]TCL77336.1 uncharacterized protein DUF3800 [Curtobacterium sp. PhB128]TCL93294.1 uncharacterized protein DUF3800 [Curtobacterium sp. PhB138]